MNFKKCLRQEPADPHEFQASESYIVRSCLNNDNKNLKIKTSQERWLKHLLLSDDLS